MAAHPCKGMTKAQREAFEQIASGMKPRASHKTLKSLREAGLVDYRDVEIGRDALGKIVVPEWFVPMPTLIQWCEWCSENVPD